MENIHSETQNASTPAHLSEFVDILNNNKLKKSPSSYFQHNNNNNNNSEQDMSQSNSNQGFPSLSGFRNLSLSNQIPRKPSVSYASSMTSSFRQFNNIVNKKDIENTKKNIKNLQIHFEKFSKQVNDLTNTTSDIALILENMSNNSKCDDDDDILLNLAKCSGFFHMLGTHQQVLSKTIQTQFLIPLNKHMVQIYEKFEEHDKLFKQDFKLNYKNLQKQEKIVMNQKINHKNLISYRENIYELENKLSIIENLKIDYYNGSAHLLNDHSKTVLKLVASVISIQLELYEELAKKGWNGGGLEFVYRMKDEREEEEEKEEDEDERVEGQNKKENDKSPKSLSVPQQQQSPSKDTRASLLDQQSLQCDQESVTSLENDNDNTVIIDSENMICQESGANNNKSPNTSHTSNEETCITTENNSNKSKNTKIDEKSISVRNKMFNNVLGQQPGPDLLKLGLPEDLCEEDSSFSLPQMEEEEEEEEDENYHANDQSSISSIGIQAS